MKLEDLDIKETQIQLSILKYLKIIGAVAGKTKTVGINRKDRYYYDKWTFRGFPDITCFYKNKLYFIEVKSKGGRQSREQKQFQKLCEGANVPYILARSIDDVHDVMLMK